MYKMNWDRRYTMVAVYAFLVLAASMSFYWFLSNIGVVRSFIWSIVAPIRPVIYGFALAYLLNPILRFFEERLKKRITSKKIKPKHIRGMSMVLTYLLTALVVTGFFLIIIPQVGYSLYTLAGQISRFAELFQSWIIELLAHLPPEILPPDFVERVTLMISENLQSLMTSITALLPKVFSFTLNFTNSIIRIFVAGIISVYLLASKDIFKSQALKIACAYMSRDDVNRMIRIGTQADKMFGGFIVGKLLDSLIIGILCFVSLQFMNMPNAILVSFIVGITNIIPFFGPFIGAIPGFLIIFIESPMQAYIFIVFILILQQIDGNIIGPMILGDSTGLSPFWVLFAILFFGGLFGITGMILGVPTFGVLYWLFSLHVKQRLQQKGLPVETERYNNGLDQEDS